MTTNSARLAAATRLVNRADKATGCWLIPTANDGYVHVGINLEGSWQFAAAHRLVYEAFVGEIPEPLVLDHLCRQKNCINYAHLEPVEQRENVLRGIGPTALNAAKTHCPRGHSLGPVIPRKHRDCRECHAAAQRAYSARKKAQS